MKKNSEWR